MNQTFKEGDNQEPTLEILQARITELEENLKATTEASDAGLRFAQFAMDRASDCIFWMRPDAKFIYVNDAACCSLGYTREELLSLTVHDIDPDYPAHIWPEMWEKIKKGGSFSFDAHHRTKKGHVFPVEIRVNYLEFEGKEFNCAIARDLSERKRMKSELEAMESLTHSLLDFFPELIFFKDVHGRYLDINPQFEKTFHLRRQDIIGKTDEEVFSTQQTAGFRANDKQVIQTQRPLKCEETVIHDDGPHTAIMHKFPLKDPNGNVYGIGGITTDITLRKKTERELKTSEERSRRQLAELELLYNSSPIGLCFMDTDMRFVRINDRMASINGCPAKDHIGRTLGEVLPTVAKKVEPIYQKVIETQQPQIEFEISGETQSNPSRKSAWLVSYHPLVENGKVLGVSTVVQDITDLKQMETQFRQVQKMEALGTLAGGIAHDFNNVLGVILGYAQLSQYKTNGNAALENHLQEIINAGKRAKDLVQQILTFSRHEKILHKPVELTSLVPDVLKMVRATLPSTIDIHQHVSKQAKLMLGDPTQIQQVVLNLCANAEYTMRGTGGTLEVGVENIEFKEPQNFNHLTLKPGLYIRLLVKDTGQGISPENMNKILDPFFTTKGVGEGTGMGLAVVHGIVIAHHGAISVESKLGEGTTFAVYFPSVELNNEAQIMSTPLETSLKKKIRILFVDDEFPLACVGKEILETLGCDVDICHNGLEAFERFRRDPNQYDVVISDQTMPGMTGEKLAQQLLHLRTDLPIILCTGFSHSMTPEKAEQMGIKALLKKPVQQEDLIQTLNKIF